MMRKLIITALTLSPMLLHSQASSPAQPQASQKAAVLESKLTEPKIGAAAATTIPVRVSTGVIAPKLVTTAPLEESRDWRWTPAETTKTAVVTMLVGPNGKPSDVRIVRSLGTDRDKDILSAVSKYRFEPGTLNHQPTPIELDLTVTVLNPHQ